MPRGGPQPGAGAPRGNLNALKSGRYSAQLKAALHAMLTRDDIRPILIAIFQKRRRERIRYQALILATAKIIHNAELTPIIVRKLNEYLLESGGSHRESEHTRKKR
jgi:Na+/H+ antiporter NhaA